MVLRKQPLCVRVQICYMNRRGLNEYGPTTVRRGRADVQVPVEDFLGHPRRAGSGYSVCHSLAQVPQPRGTTMTTASPGSMVYIDPYYRIRDGVIQHVCGHWRRRRGTRHSKVIHLTLVA